MTNRECLRWQSIVLWGLCQTCKYNHITLIMRKDHFSEASQLVGLCAYLAGKQFHFGGYSSIQPKSASPCPVWLCAKEIENHVCQNMDKIHNSKCQNTSTKLSVIFWLKVPRFFLPTLVISPWPDWPLIIEFIQRAWGHISPAWEVKTHLLAQELSSNFGQCHEGHCNAYRQHQWRLVEFVHLFTQFPEFEKTGPPQMKDSNDFKDEEAATGKMWPWAECKT